MEEYLRQTDFLDYNHPDYDLFCADFNFEGLSRKEIAIQLYVHVRDYFIYDPYHLDLTHEGLKSSSVLNKRRAWCVEKSTVLAAVARRHGIPSRLGYAVVTNHIGVERLTSYLKREEIVFHGYVELYLNEKWVKCTPAFDQRICAITKVEPLDWDGETDSMFQAYEGNEKFMEYLHFYGEFNDVPIELMNAEMKRYYPHLFEGIIKSREFSFLHL